jgi:putative spermidine/putrescine transport system ATP-binding protein
MANSALMPRGTASGADDSGSAHVGQGQAAAASKDILVAFDGVSKTYDGEALAVDTLNLAVAKGEFLTLLGPSGSGKTTSLMMLAGFETPTSGDIRLAGRSVRQIPPHRRNIGMVFQNYALFPHMTVADNVGFPLKVRRTDAAESRRKVTEALDLVGLARFAERRPAELSGGQQQRVALARALVFNPDLVLMDEPLGALDKQLRERLQLEIKRIHARLGLTVVYVTHDQSEALTLSDRIAVFNEGKVEQAAAPADIYERPETSFVAQFIGESNRLDGRVVAQQGRYCRVEVDGGLSVLALDVKTEGPGSRTTLSIRPERIALGSIPPACESVITAVVDNLIYHGDHIRVRLRLDNGCEFEVKAANSGRNVQLSNGETIEIGWHADDCRALNPLD